MSLPPNKCIKGIPIGLAQFFESRVGYAVRVIAGREHDAPVGRFKLFRARRPRGFRAGCSIHSRGGLARNREVPKVWSHSDDGTRLRGCNPTAETLLSASTGLAAISYQGLVTAHFMEVLGDQPSPRFCRSKAQTLAGDLGEHCPWINFS